MAIKKYKRLSTNITVSIFYEQHCMNKYNYEPAYQRDYNVWDESQKAFLIDTMFKNFPIPPIFLEQKINKGKTIYDVIDGKQRLNSIVEFIHDGFGLPNDFGKDVYGSERIGGLKFSQIQELATENEDIAEFVDTFWSYVINIEYIEKPDEKIVDNIFDRLNRGGEKLNPAELRKAKYYDSALYSAIVRVRKNEVSSRVLKKLDSVRMQDVSFLTEIFLLIKSNGVIDGVEKDRDRCFESYVDEIEAKAALDLEKKVIHILSIFNCIDIDLEKYRIEGSSHLYALIFISWYFGKSNIKVDSKIIDRINLFYVQLRKHDKNEYIEIYSKSMQSASRYKYSRKRRVKALLNYLGYDEDINLL